MENKELPNWLLILISWLFSVYFLISFLWKVDLSQSVPTIYYLFLVLGVSFAFLPFMSKIKIGTLLELERQINETKNEVKDFKEETRQSLSIISTNVNTIGNLSNTINIHLPGEAQLSRTNQNLKSLVTKSEKGLETLSESEKIKDEIVLDMLYKIFYNQFHKISKATAN